jgi:uracil phosphoribosyltransferase
MHHFGGRLYTHALEQFRLVPDNLYAVAVMRAGWGLCNGAMMNNYQGDIGIIDAKRNEQTLKSKINVYKCSRELEHCETLVFETMLATGDSLSNSIRLLKTRSRARRITALTLLSAPEGLARMQADHPDVTILTVRIDERLDRKGFIVPGLGDAGDRYFGPIE